MSLKEMVQVIEFLILYLLNDKYILICSILRRLLKQKMKVKENGKSTYSGKNWWYLNDPL